ncbi:MAG: hypothetical protein K8H74_19495 [Notoacmeibacter sp.]|nr:hypothetical protein [Notoacmeibacter sp.]
MKRGTKILAVIAGAAFVGWLGWRLAYPSYSWRQKLTVTVETPEGDTLSASSVSEVAVTFQPKLLPEIPPIRRSFRGEAAVLEIPGGGFLFVLLRGPGGPDYMMSVAITVFQDLLPPHSSRSIFSKLSGMRESREIPPNHYPLMVTFGDIADPKTVKRVDPDNLAASFGPGTRLTSVTLTITGEPVTEGRVEKVLGWINHLEDYRADPNNPFTNTLPREIGGLRRM